MFFNVIHSSSYFANILNILPSIFILTLFLVASSQAFCTLSIPPSTQLSPQLYIQLPQRRKSTKAPPHPEFQIYSEEFALSEDVLSLQS